MCTEAEVRRTLSSVRVEGWGDACEAVREPGLFGMNGFVGGYRRRARSDGRVLTCWIEDAETLWIVFEVAGEFMASAPFECRNDGRDSVRFGEILLRLMRGEYRVTSGLLSRPRLTIQGFSLDVTFH